MIIIEQQASNIIKDILSSHNIDETGLSIKKNTSYVSVNIDTRLAFRVKFTGKKYYLSVSNRFKDLFSDLNAYYIKSDKDYLRIPLKNPEDLYSLSDKIVEVYSIIMDNGPIDTFGCCSLYQKCSDAKQCIDPDREHAKGCIYRTHLEKGEIFYGRNRNVN